MQLSQLVDGHLPMLPPWNIGKCLKKCVGNGPKMGPIGSWPVSMSRGTQERRYRQYGPSLLLDAKVMRRSRCVMREMEDSGHIQLGMDQFLLIPFLVGWTSIYQLFWCSPGVQGFDTLPVHQCSSLVFGTSLLHVWNWSPTFTPQNDPVLCVKSSSLVAQHMGITVRTSWIFFPLLLAKLRILCLL